MKDLPHAPELLEAARAALVSEILPALPEKLRYTGLMVAHALAIAGREVAAGDEGARAECDRLCKLLEEAHVPERTEELGLALARYNRRLSEDIRAGRFDAELRGPLLEHLRRTTGEKLAVSNPKALGRDGGDR